jgi:carbon-monoxide dehydrogenase medium subunit
MVSLRRGEQMGTRVLREFEYIKPTSIEEVMSMLGKWGEKAKVLAGGSDLLVMMKLLNVRPECLVDITGINELKGITLKEKELNIG